MNAAGDVFVADNYNFAIHRIDRAGGFATIAGHPGDAGATDGLGESARFSTMLAMTVGPDGNLYVAENSRVRKVTPEGNVSTLTGSLSQTGYVDGPLAGARFSDIRALACASDGAIYIADHNNYVIRKVSSGAVTTVAGKPGDRGLADGDASTARLFDVRGMVLEPGGSLVVNDFTTFRRISPTGAITTLVTGNEGAFAVDGRPPAARLSQPRAMTIDTAGNIFFTEFVRVRMMTPDGEIRTIAGVPADQVDSGNVDGSGLQARFADPNGIAVSATGAVYVADSGNQVVRRLIPAGPRAGTPVFALPPASGSASVGGTVFVTTAPMGDPAPVVQWLHNGTLLRQSSGPSLMLTNLQPENAGVYQAIASNTAGEVSSPAAIVGIVSTGKVAGAGEELQPTNLVHPNGNVFDQVLLTGTAETITADAGQVTRTSFVDYNDDIVQVEFSGAGSLTILLDGASGPATPLNYNQGVTYMKGNAGIVIVGADETTNVSIFSVGRATAVNGSLFKAVQYDGRADVAFLAIQSTNGKFGGVRASNAAFSANKGVVGVYAPDVTIIGPLFIGNITAYDAAVPMLKVAAASDARVAGGDMQQRNGQAVEVSGITQLKFTAGTDSHGGALPAQVNRAIFRQDGVDMTSRIVVNP